MPKLDFVADPVAAVSVHLSDFHQTFLDLVNPGVVVPLDVALAHLGFEHALGVAHTIQSKMPDVRFRPDYSFTTCAPSEAVLLRLPPLNALALSSITRVSSGEAILRPASSASLAMAEINSPLLVAFSPFGK